jgi:hypothetical protein
MVTSHMVRGVTPSTSQPPANPKKTIVPTLPKKTTMTNVPWVSMDYNVIEDMSKKTKANVLILDIYNILHQRELILQTFKTSSDVP